MLNLGDFTTSDTLYVPLVTYDSSGGSVTLTGLAVTDIEIYKDGSVTQRSSDAGFALLDTDGIDFDTTTGLHGFSVDLSDNTDAGFYAAGSQYWLVVNSITINTQTVVAVYYFTIGRVLKPTTAGNTLDVTSTGAAGINWGNIENKTTANDLSATDIQLCDTVTTYTGNTLQTGDTYGTIGATALANISDTYDGTGYTSSVAPATQSQLDSIALTGAAVSTSASSVTLTTGTQTAGTFADTASLDGSNHVHIDTAGVLDLYYEFSIGGDGKPTGVTFTGYLNGNNDDLQVLAYNWTGATWDQVGTLNGKASSANEVNNYTLFTSHVGTGANIGKVRIRFDDGGVALTSATLTIDQLYVSYAVVSRTVGYALGRVWIDTAGGVAGTESFVNGTADNPVDTLADAVTIAGNLNIHDFHITSNSSLTLAANFQDHNLYGIGYTLNFAGFDCSGTHFYHASPVNGVVLSGGTDHVDILDSIVVNVTVNDSHFTNCSFKGTTTFGSVASDIRVINCRSIIAGSTTPIFDFGTDVGISHHLTIANWQNGIQIDNFNAQGTDLMSLSGTGQLKISASCTGGTINLRGQWKITDSSGGAVSITYDDVAQNLIDVLADTADMQPKLGTPVTDISADLVVIDNFVDSIETTLGTAGDGLTDITINAASIDLVWEELRIDHTTSGSFGAVGVDVTSILIDTSNMQPKLGTPAVDVSADIAAIKVVADAIPTTAMRGTENAATAASLTTHDGKLDTAQLDLDTITGTDGVLISTGQTATAWSSLEASAGQIVECIVDTFTNTHTPTITEFQSDTITEPTPDHFIGRVIIFTSGALLRQATDITDYVLVGGIGQFTVTAMTDAPADNDNFIIV